MSAHIQIQTTPAFDWFEDMRNYSNASWHLIDLLVDKLVGGKADPADTVRRNAIGVLDKAGNIRLAAMLHCSLLSADGVNNQQENN